MTCKVNMVYTCRLFPYFKAYIKLCYLHIQYCPPYLSYCQLLAIVVTCVNTQSVL